MDCVLLRHGIAVERGEWKGADADRPLTDRGAKRVVQVAAGLKQLGVQPSCVFTSPLVRARETAKILHARLCLRSGIRVVDELFSDGAPDGILKVLQDTAPDACVILVGHEPHLGLLASLLLSGRPSSSFPLKKSGACLIELSVPVKPGRGTLRWWMGPSQLRALGKKHAKLNV